MPVSALFVDRSLLMNFRTSSTLECIHNLDEAVVRSGSADHPCTAQAGGWILAATIFGSSMAFIDSTVVNVALPAPLGERVRLLGLLPL
jgi:hypothetical protein